MTDSSATLLPASGPLYFGRDAALFGWLHAPAEVSGRPAVVICDPLGYEYIRAHRSLRLLACELADAGHFVLRFDYRTTGDSAGAETDDHRLDALLGSIDEATDTVLQLSGSDRVSIVGLRLGATLAARIAERRDIAQLVLWAPCDSGALYVREQQIMAAAQRKRIDDRDDTIDGVDAGGFLLTPAMQFELSGLTFRDEAFVGATRVLLVNRDDMRVPPTLAQNLEARAASTDVIESVNFRDMMLPPQLATVPAETIAAIGEWIATTSEALAGVAADAGHATLRRTGAANETALRFGPAQRLFGIVTTPQEPPHATAPAVILLCGGATHRVSANRMYVDIARRLAAGGTAVMRMDLSGIGDSLPREGYPPNKPYTDHLVQDVEAAMSAIEGLTGQQRFILFGLCSGAYAAMLAAAQLQNVAGVILANQLVYHLSERDLERLGSGEIASAHELDFPRSQSPVYRGAVKILRRLSPFWGAPGEWLSSYLLGGNLPRNIEGLLERGTELAIVHSSRDDAVDALSICAGKRVRRHVAAGRITLETFAGTDHTFSPTSSQYELADWLERYIAGLSGDGR